MDFPDDVEVFIGEFEHGTLPKSRWTHEAHLLVALWYLSRHDAAQALPIVKTRITAYNEAVGIVNSNTSGYHETLTRLYLHALARHREAADDESLRDCYARLLASRVARRDWPLSHYSRERLFSVAARRGWIEPDLQPLA
ncbi:MAG: hypothetical protein MUF07_10860 [Steroidobacteraceae bacterium]|jgi:hypothetical protein|nr:hypothetical protein [Steroidobacteraceae bacterium]